MREIKRVEKRDYPIIRGKIVLACPLLCDCWLLLIELLLVLGLRWLAALDDELAEALGVLRVEVPSLRGRRRLSHVCRSAYLIV